MEFAHLEQVGKFLGAERVDVRTLHQLWARRQPVVKPVPAKPGAEPEASPLDWLRQDAEWVRQFAAHALAAGEFLLVCDVAQEGLRLEAGAADAAARKAFARLRCDYAAALARLGSANRAQAELELVLESERTEVLDARERAQVLTQLGDVRIDAARGQPTPAEFEAGCVSALDACQRALTFHPGSLAALSQCAILRLHLRQGEMARAAAEKIREATATADAAELRALVARAGALGVLGEIAEARATFRKLAAVPRVTTWELAEARHRARFLAPACGLPRTAFDDCFPPLQLLVFSGHMPDDASRKTPRFPDTPESIAAARAAIAQRLEKLHALVGFSSAAAGGDLLFLEELLRRGGTAHVVLPWSKEQFLEERVRPCGEEWVASFEAVLAQAASVREMGETYRLTDPIGLEYQAEVTAGLATLIAHASRLDLQPLALWDGGTGRAGGTGAFVALWRDELRVPVEIVALPSTGPAASAPAPAELRTHRVEQPIVCQHVETILFADIHGYSKLREQMIPNFVREFMGRVAEVVAASPYAPMSVNTWGDALYFVFDRVADGGRFALELLRMIAGQAEHWQRIGLGWNDGGVLRTPNVRIGLHTGPVYLHFDPVVRRLSFTGAHVSRAARIEPITEVGGVYASEEFAALAAVNRAEGFTCEFVGTLPLAKGFPGQHRIYRLVPVHLLPLERLARLTHRNYVEAMRARGASPATLPALCPWEDLPPERQAANRAQAADLGNKLRALGYELTENFGLHPTEIVLATAQLDALARGEHRRWMDERLSQGWTCAPVRDDALKQHPSLVPWEELDEAEREKDRDAIRNVPLLVAEAGLRVRRLPRTG